MEGTSEIHLEQDLNEETLDALAGFICGDDRKRFPLYRSSLMLTRFFQNIDIMVKHDGTTRQTWVVGVLKQLQLYDLERVILRLVDLREYIGVRDSLNLAVASMNEILAMENLAVTFDGARPILYTERLNLNETVIPTSLTTDETAFLSKQFRDDIKIQDLGFDTDITEYLQSRVDEIQSCPKNKVPLGTIFLLGSTLEGIMLAFALKDQAKYMGSRTAPKFQGNVKRIHDWKLAELIDVAYAVQDISLDVKRFSHVLRDFRNYIHPFHQMEQSFKPSQGTVDICWQVFKAAFDQLQSKTNIEK